MMAKFSVPKFKLSPKPNIPDIEQFKKFVAKKIGDTSRRAQLPYQDLYRQYYDQIIAEWNKGKSLTTLPPKIFNKIPVIAALSFDGKPKLIDADKFRQAWLALVDERKDSRHARKIYRVLLRNYHSYRPHLDHIFACTRPLIRNSSLPLCKKLAALDSRYEVLNPLLVKNIAAYISQHPNRSVDDTLLDMGVAGSLREADIGAAVGTEILKQNDICLRRNDDSMLAITFAYFSDDKEDSLRLEYMRSDLLTSLLENYVDQDPPAKIKQALEAFIDRYLGDPRANPKWHGVEERIKQVVSRWKVAVTLRAFFALLDHVASQDSTHARHWQARKKFWQGYLDRKKITGAWVVLGRQYFYNHEFLNVGDLKFGEFSSTKGIQSSHCAIIMQIKGRTLTEWSHVGGLRIWEKDDERAPQLYRDTYHPDALKNKRSYEEGYVRHLGNWQEKARALLEEDTEFRRW